MIRTVRLITLIGALALVVGAAFDWNPQRDLAAAARFYRTRNYDQALRLARRAAWTGRGDRKLKVSALLVQARAALGFKRPDYALKCLDLVLGLDQANGRAYLLRGRVRLQTENIKGALADLNRGLDLAAGASGKRPRSLAPYLAYRGWANLTLGRTDQAGQDARAALELNPSEPGAHWLRSRLHEMNGRWLPALVAGEKAMSLAQQRNGYFFLSAQGKSWTNRLVRLRLKNKVDPTRPFTGTTD